MKRIKLILGVLVLTVISFKVSAQKVNTNENNIANNGYDIVNYFTSNSAKRGSSSFSINHNGVIYYFVNTEHLNSFKANPEKYLPQYDGYCAFAVAQMSKKIPVDPETFRIDDGKLYLFYNDYWEGKPFNTIVPWINNEAKMEQMAVTNWEKIKKN